MSINFPQITNCIHCQAELLDSNTNIAGAKAKLRQCPNCINHFMTLSNEDGSVLAIYVRVNGFRVANWFFQDSAECVIDKVKSLTGILYNGASGSIASLTLNQNEAPQRVLQIKQFVNFDFSNIKEFERKLKVLLTFS